MRSNRLFAYLEILCSIAAPILAAVWFGWRGAVVALLLVVCAWSGNALKGAR
jgi:hypothetical protein